MQMLRTHQRDSEAFSAIKRGVLRPGVENRPGRVSEGRVSSLMLNQSARALLIATPGTGSLAYRSGFFIEGEV